MKWANPAFASTWESMCNSTPNKKGHAIMGGRRCQQSVETGC
jgi:hypothetical protein